MGGSKVDIPSLSGKVILITGANSGLGEAVLTALAQHNPSKIYLSARSQAKAEAALARVKGSSAAAEKCQIEILLMDLASFASIKSAAAKVLEENERLDMVHLNGGIASTPYGTTADGYELTFGTNYLGHILLMQLLMPLLQKTTQLPSADVRVVAISSVAHRRFAPKEGIRFDGLRTDGRDRPGMELYGQSNVARTLFAYEMAKRYPAITTTSAHPGTVKSNIWNGEKEGMGALWQYVIFPVAVYLTGVTTEVGALTQLWCSVSDDVENGAYYEPVGTRVDGTWTRSDVLAKKLWEWTDDELKKNGAPGWPSL